MPEPRGSRNEVYTYSVVAGPAGLSIDRVTGLVAWRPTSSQVDVPYEVRILALRAAGEPVQTIYTFELTALSPTIVRRTTLDFSAPAASGEPDATGQLTGFTTRLPGTGTALPANDPNLQLNPATSVLALRTTQADFFGRAGLPGTSAPGVALAGLGFTGNEDFAVTTIFRPLIGLQFIDQVGVYVGASSDALTRAGTIVFGAPERYSVHSENGADHDGRFFGFGFDGSDGMTVTLTREAGVWRYYVDGVEWNPLTAPAFLNGRGDLVAGVFAITPLNATPKTIEIDSFALVVATSEPALSNREQWRIRHFAVREAEGIAADRADPDDDELSNRYEYALGTDPLESERFSDVIQPGTSGTPPRATLTFNRIADPALTDVVEASSRRQSGYEPIWSSTGAENVVGPVTVADVTTTSSSRPRYLRLVVRE